MAMSQAAAAAPNDLRVLDSRHHFHPFTDHEALSAKGGPRVIVRAEGVHLWDADGGRLIDAMAGLWCVNIGYGRRELADAAARQMAELPYYNTFFQTTHPPAAELGRVLAEVTPPGFDHVFIHQLGLGGERHRDPDGAPLLRRAGPAGAKHHPLPRQRCTTAAPWARRASAG